jgi:hypothetical protein
MSDVTNTFLSDLSFLKRIIHKILSYIFIISSIIFLLIYFFMIINYENTYNYIVLDIAKIQMVFIPFLCTLLYIFYPDR